MVGTLGRCANAASGHATAAKKRDELAPFQLIDLHLTLNEPGPQSQGYPIRA
jgi:hypothetical protein